MQLDSSAVGSEASNTEISGDEGKGLCNLGERSSVSTQSYMTISSTQSYTLNFMKFITIYY